MWSDILHATVNEIGLSCTQLCNGIYRFFDSDPQGKRNSYIELCLTTNTLRLFLHTSLRMKKGVVAELISTMSIKLTQVYCSIKQKAAIEVKLLPPLHLTDHASCNMQWPVSELTKIVGASAHGCELASEELKHDSYKESYASITRSLIHDAFNNTTLSSIKLVGDCEVGDIVCGLRPFKNDNIFQFPVGRVIQVEKRYHRSSGSVYIKTIRGDVVEVQSAYVPCFAKLSIPSEVDNHLFGERQNRHDIYRPVKKAKLQWLDPEETCLICDFTAGLIDQLKQFEFSMLGEPFINLQYMKNSVTLVRRIGENLELSTQIAMAIDQAQIRTRITTINNASYEERYETVLRNEGKQLHDHLTAFLSDRSQTNGQPKSLTHVHLKPRQVNIDSNELNTLLGVSAHLLEAIDESVDPSSNNWLEQNANKHPSKKCYSISHHTPTRPNAKQLVIGKLESGIKITRNNMMVHEVRSLSDGFLYQVPDCAMIMASIEAFDQLNEQTFKDEHL